jgi:hypothetical protein
MVVVVVKAKPGSPLTPPAPLPAPQDSKTKIRKASWQEEDEKLWEGEAPKLNVQYDELYGFMLNVIIMVNQRNTKLKDDQLLERCVIIS